jgi:DNA processing protein
MNDVERLARLRLAAALPYRPNSCRVLVEAFGTAAETMARPSDEWARALELRPEEAKTFHAAGSRFDAERELKNVERLGARIVWPGLPDYPRSLEAIPDPPALLWMRGELKPVVGVAIVGTRAPSPYGKKTASKLAEGAARAGLAVVSGLARGIDTAAHEAALAAGGATWAVLGSGLENVYPSANAELARRIAESGGAVISEHPLETEPLKEHFPRRNRVISGLSFGTVVVEGRLQSGALITAKCALEQGRDVFAVPGPVDWELARGPHRLIRDGAKLIESIDDVLQELNLFNAMPEPGGEALVAVRPEVAEPHGRVLTALGPTARTFEEIASDVGWGAARLSETLTEMELLGLVGGLPGRRYYRKS